MSFSLGKPPEPRCPACSRQLSWESIQFDSPFQCPVCGETLFVPKSYNQRVTWVTLPTAVVIGYLLGGRGFNWLILVVLGFFPLAVIVATVMRKLFPPTLVVGDERL